MLIAPSTVLAKEAPSFAKRLNQTVTPATSPSTSAGEVRDEAATGIDAAEGVRSPRSWIGRLSLGAAHVNANGSVTGPLIDAELGVSGTGVLASGDIEWRISRGLYLGGSLGWGSAAGPTVSLDGVEVELEDARLQQIRIGPSLTYYLEQDRGLRAHAFAGVMGLKLSIGEGDDSQETESDVGPAVAASLGYDFSLGRDATLGVSLNALLASVASEGASGKEQLTVFSPSLSITGTYGAPRRR